MPPMLEVDAETGEILDAEGQREDAPEHHGTVEAGSNGREAPHTPVAEPAAANGDARQIADAVDRVKAAYLALGGDWSDAERRGVDINRAAGRGEGDRVSAMPRLGPTARALGGRVRASPSRRSACA